MVHPYYMEEELLMRYVEDNKQRFEVIVIPQDLSKVVLRLAHDDSGHNGSARTYMIIRRNCCDMGQNDTIGKIELNPSFVLSSNRTNCKNDIQ